MDHFTQSPSFDYDHSWLYNRNDVNPIYYGFVGFNTRENSTPPMDSDPILSDWNENDRIRQRLISSNRFEPYPDIWWVTFNEYAGEFYVTYDPVNEFFSNQWPKVNFIEYDAGRLYNRPFVRVTYEIKGFCERTTLSYPGPIADSYDWPRNDNPGIAIQRGPLPFEYNAADQHYILNYDDEKAEPSHIYRRITETVLWGGDPVPGEIRAQAWMRYQQAFRQIYVNGTYTDIMYPSYGYANDGTLWDILPELDGLRNRENPQLLQDFHWWPSVSKVPNSILNIPTNFHNFEDWQVIRLRILGVHPATEIAATAVQELSV